MRNAPTNAAQVLLKRYFGYDDFRPLQADIIDSIMGGRDTVVLMPTGGGKSLCYQLPALALSGVTLVISPLIALMKDQVDALKRNGVPSDFLNSTQPRAEQVRVQRAAFNGEIKLLYVAPERIVQPGFQQFLNSLEISLIAVDEAHCISEWGHEFRPDYRNLRVLRHLSEGTPFIALTATATEQVREDIESQLELRDPARFVASFDRPNLRYSVLPNSDRYDFLVGWLRENPNSSAIVYRSSRAGTESMAADLSEDGIRALPYHAGLEDSVRIRNQELFVRDEARVIVATVAFGMGIDKPDVRMVMHYETPRSIERYYQESGRAGRDGLEAECVLFFGHREREREEYLIDRIADDTQRAVAQRQLSLIVSYCQQTACRRAALLRHFGENSGQENCANCDICLSDTFDATVISQKILSAVIRTGERFGSTHISQVLRGANVRRVEERGHNGLSVFGIVDDYSDSELRELMTMLVSRGLLVLGVEYPTLSVTPEGRRFLKHREEIRLPSPRSGTSKSAARTSGLEYDQVLFEKLREVRTRLATELDVPAYVVFGDAPLREMALYYPLSEDSFLKINGVGQKKLEDFGSEFLRVIRSYTEANGLSEVPNVRSRPVSKERKRSSKSDTLAQTRELAIQGHPVASIAEARELSRTTIETHLEMLIEKGSIADPSPYLPDEARVKKIESAFEILGDTTLKPVKEHLGDGFEYGELRLTRAFLRYKYSLSQPEMEKVT